MVVPVLVAFGSRVEDLPAAAVVERRCELRNECEKLLGLGKRVSAESSKHDRLAALGRTRSRQTWWEGRVRAGGGGDEGGMETGAGRLVEAASRAARAWRSKDDSRPRPPFFICQH
jgi:hypothetical protein